MSDGGRGCSHISGLVGGIVISDRRALMDCARAALNRDSVVDRPLRLTGSQHAGLTSLAVNCIHCLRNFGRDLRRLAHRAMGASSAASSRQIAHNRRAVLFASATAALFLPRRATNPCSHTLKGSVRPSMRLTTARAPWISCVRKYLSPRLLMPRSWGSSPLEYCFGTNPKEALTCRPLR